MISFDDLVDVGGDTEQLENEMREIRLNTQINRFSIIDCTNSIESLSSMISTITVADYSASLYSLSSDTLALYNSLTTITGGGGGGFGYLEPYSAHSTESFIYNCNDILSNQSFIETFKEVGPNINFDGVSFTTNQKLNLKGQTFNSCLIQSNTEYMMLNYESMKSNKLINNGFINISCLTNTSNSYSGNSFLTITGSVINKNTISQNNTFVSLNGYSIQSNSIRNNYMVDISGYSLSQNSVWGNVRLLQTINAYEMNSEDYDGDVGRFCQHGGSKNTFNDSILDYTGYSVSSNVISARSIGHVKIGYSSGGNIGGLVNGGLLTLEVFTGEKVKVNNVNGFCDMRIGAFKSCTVSSNTKCNVSAKSIGYCSFDHNSFCNIDVYANCNYNIFTNADSLKINAVSAGIAYNTFSRISTLKYYIYTNARDSFNSITELHLRDANIFISSRSITLNNITKYIFKYTDGLYSGTDFKSDYSNIYNKAFIKYVPCSWLNQTFTSSGGSGGFNYWQSYDEHPLLGYNVSERLESDIINNHISGVGPAADFYDCTFQDKFVNLTGNEFNSNHIFNNKWYHNLDYLTFNNNSYEIISSLKVNCDICSANTFNQVKYLDLTCIRPFNINSFVSCTDVHVKNMGNFKMIAESCNNINICGGNITSGVLLNNDYVKINCNNIESFNYSNNFNEISCYGCNSNTFSNCDLFSLTAYSMSNNIFNGIGDYKIKCHDCDGLTAEVRQFSIEGYNINNCLLSSYNEGDVSSLWSHDVYLKAFYAKSIRAFRISNLHLDISAYLLNANISNIGTLYLNYTLPFISEQKASSDTYLMNNVYIYSCSHFDFPAIGRVVNNGVYNWNNIPSQYVYINGVQLSKLM